MADPADSGQFFATLLDEDQRRELAAWRSAFERGAPTFDHDLFVHSLYQARHIDDRQYHAAMRHRATPDVSRTLEFPSVPLGFPIEGPYVILGELGRGAMGTVQFAKDGFLRRKVAYKRIGQIAEVSAGGVRRFVGEAQITAQLEHPNIVPVYAVQETPDGSLAYAMKLVDGLTLRQVIRQARERKAGPAAEAQELPERLEAFLRVCDAITYAHSRGVVHRDLKPANVMIGSHREVYVMDWGIARLAGALVEPGGSPGGHGTPDDELTQVGMALGTPMYMAPEQARGEIDRLGPASDQYALGLILQELATLQPALRAKTADAALMKAVQGQRDPAVHIDPHVPVAPELVAIVARATAARAEDRYPGVAEMAADVRAFLRGDPVSVLPEGPARRAARWLARHRERAVFGILILVALGSAAVSGSLYLALAASQARIEEARVLADARARADRAANQVEAEIARYGRLLEGISAAASIVLTQSEPIPGPVLAAAPSGLAEPAFWLPAGPSARPARQLARLDDALSRAMVRSSLTDLVDRPRAEQDLAIRAGNVPFSEIRVALADGTGLVFPAHDPPAADPRATDWYTTASDRRFLQWLPPHPDASGRVLATCARSIYAAEATGFLGVVSLDIVLEQELAPLIAGATPDGRVLDGLGRILVDARGPASFSPDPDPLVAELVRAGGGWRNLEGATLVVTPLREVGWFHAATYETSSR
jgi:serine/threonine-protein kinase